MSTTVSHATAARQSHQSPPPARAPEHKPPEHAPQSKPAEHVGKNVDVKA